MNANNFFEELKKYFENTPREQVLADWAKSEAFTQVGPSVAEFIMHTKKYYYSNLVDPIESDINFTNANFNPEFSSGFLFNYN